MFEDMRMDNIVVAEMLFVYFSVFTRILTIRSMLQTWFSTRR